MVVEIDTQFIFMSDTAYSKILEAKESQDENDLFLRLFISSGQGMNFGLSLDSRLSEDDLSCKHKDLTIVVDRISYPYLFGASVDYAETDEKNGYQISAPLAQVDETSGVGCGSCSGEAGCC